MIRRAALQAGWRFGPPLAAAALLLLLFDDGRLDFAILRPYFDAAQHAFPRQHDPFFEGVLHHGAKYAVLIFGLAALARGLLGWRLPEFAARRRAWLFVAAGMLAATTTVTLLKQNSARHCPWDLQEFGGFAPHRGLLAPAATEVTRGRCFPGGHAAGGFSIMALFFAWRRSRPRLARAALAGALALGFAMGWTRMMQGAHLLSHNLWAAVVVWTVLAALDWGWQPDAAGDREAEPPRQQGHQGAQRTPTT